jgi:SpoVK/Ycf46/Vps4 family AAA+-type ATPase
MAISTREPRAALGVAIEIERPTRREQYAAWTQALGSGRDQAAQRLAAQFNLGLPAIADLAQQSESDAGVWRACLGYTRPRLDQLATRIDARAGWRDLVLPPNERQLLYSVVRHAAQRHVVYDEWGFRRKTARGLGIAALFAGDSGTGKTLAAEVLARHLALNLYRIDLSAVVSKYIGETEKNLRRVFDAAEDGGAILFFDEADALFGKRTEVKDSHDRYANIEINYLLQRIESFSGLTILSTNLKAAVDPAFLRRLRFVINFPFPDAAARLRIWERAMPREAPVEREHPRQRVDFTALSRLNLTGGSIQNIAVNSAFAAATRGRRFTWPIVLDAVRAELRKLDRPTSEVDRGLSQRRGVAHA